MQNANTIETEAPTRPSPNTNSTTTTKATTTNTTTTTTTKATTTTTTSATTTTNKMNTTTSAQPNTTPKPNNLCDEQFQYVSSVDKCYYISSLFESGLRWTAAEKLCSSKGAHLASPSTAEQNTAVRDVIG